MFSVKELIGNKLHCPPVASSEKLKNLGSKKFVGGQCSDFSGSMIIELSGACVWFGGNLLFATILDLLKTVVVSFTKNQKNKMNNVKMNKDIKSLITGVLVVATALENIKSHEYSF